MFVFPKTEIDLTRINLCLLIFSLPMIPLIELRIIV